MSKTEILAMLTRLIEKSTCGARRADNWRMLVDADILLKAIADEMLPGIPASSIHQLTIDPTGESHGQVS